MRYGCILQRETVELAQRLSLNYTAWMSETFTQMTMPAASDPAFGYFQPPPAVVYRQLRECVGRDYDVIIVGKLDWAMMPGEQRLDLLENVSNGTGLVYVNPPPGNKELDIVFGGRQALEGRDFISAAVPIAALPGFADKPADRLIKTSMFDKGRVVVLDYGEEIPAKNAQGWPCLTLQWDTSDTKTGYVSPDHVPEIELVPYEYYQALVARAVIWASTRTPETGIGEIQLGEKITWPASAGEAKVALKGDPGGKSYRAAVRSRRDYARVYTLPSPQAGKETTLSLPDIPAGEYFLDVWLMTADGKQVMDWSSRAFSVVADVSIGGLTLDNKSYKDHVVPTLSGARANGGCMSNPDTLKAVDEWGATQSDQETRTSAGRIRVSRRFASTYRKSTAICRR